MSAIVIHENGDRSRIEVSEIASVLGEETEFAFLIESLPECIGIVKSQPGSTPNIMSPLFAGEQLFGPVVVCGDARPPTDCPEEIAESLMRGWAL